MSTTIVKTVFCTAALLMLTAPVQAGVINGGDLLDQAGANQLEIWLGSGDLDFTNIWDGTTGDTSYSWHGAVDGIGKTISIFDITFEDQKYLIGGYRSINNSSVVGYKIDNDAFIFNLTSGVKYSQTPSSGYDIYSHYDAPYLFPTFGGGHDLYGGSDFIGGYSGYAYGAFTYGDGSNNGIWLQGLNLFGSMNPDFFQVNGIETYTFKDAGDPGAAVPEPATILLMGTGLAFAGSRRVKKRNA